MTTRKEAIDYFKKVESLTGFEAVNVRQLKSNATEEEIKEAINADRNWFKGYGDSITTAV